jgi:pyridoxal 5'-phosphate synthase pdxS subunit
MTSKPLPYEHTAVMGSNGVKRGMAEMLKGGVIMDVVNVEQARIGHFV